MTRFGVLISGGGSNLQAIIDSIADGCLNAEVSIVISSRSDAYGLVRAASVGIQTMSLSREVYQQAPYSADELIVQALKRAETDYVVMAGYMRKVTPLLLQAFPNRVINLHPALLPSFPGAHGIEDAFAHGVKVTGVTVHFANAEYDEGPIIAQRVVEIHEDDTLDSLSERIHTVEHQLLPHVLNLLVEGRVALTENGKVRIL